MTEGLPPGWYAPENGERRFWTGAEWLTPEVPTDEPPAESAESSIPGSDELASAETGGIEDLPVIAAIPSRRRRRWPAALAAVVVVIAGVAAWWFLRPTVEKEVSAQCEEALRDVLKNPGSAVFYDTRVVNNGSSRFVVNPVRAPV